MEDDFLILLNMNITEEEMFYLKLKNVDDKLFEFTYWLREMKKKYPSVIINPYDIIGKQLYKVNDGLIKGIDYTTSTDAYISSISIGNFPVVYFGIGVDNIYNIELMMKKSMFFENIKDAKDYVYNEFK